MIRSLPHTDRVADPWGFTSRGIDWLGRLATAVLREAARVWRPGNGTAKLHVSEEWLEEYARRSRKHSGDI